MNSSYSGWTLMTVVLLSFGVAVPALAQSDRTPASTLMRSAGQSMENAGSDTWVATRDTYYATKIALRDTETTAKIKAALDRDPTTHPYDIYVTTTAGIVTLEGKISSHEVDVRVKKLAMATEGVRQIRDRMVIISSGSSPG